MEKYILDGKRVVTTDDFLAWAQWFETADRTVARTVIGACTVSTVFLGLDHRFSDDGPPLLFETMIFEEGPLRQWHDDQWRYSTWEEAEAGHESACRLLMDRMS